MGPSAANITEVEEKESGVTGAERNQPIAARRLRQVASEPEGASGKFDDHKGKEGDKGEMDNAIQDSINHVGLYQMENFAVGIAIKAALTSAFSVTIATGQQKIHKLAASVKSFSGQKITVAEVRKRQDSLGRIEGKGAKAEWQKPWVCPRDAINRRGRA